MKTSLYIAIIVLVATVGLIMYKKTPSLMIGKQPVFGDYVCWASPTPAALKKCEGNHQCTGSGVYAWHSKERIAKRTAMRFCKKTYGECDFDYCERLNKKSDR